MNGAEPKVKKRKNILIINETNETNLIKNIINERNKRNKWKTYLQPIDDLTKSKWIGINQKKPKAKKKKKINKKKRKNLPNVENENL